jgi:hypothetical protein
MRLAVLAVLRPAPELIVYDVLPPQRTDGTCAPARQPSSTHEVLQVDGQAVQEPLKIGGLEIPRAPILLYQSRDWGRGNEQTISPGNVVRLPEQLAEAIDRRFRVAFFL